MSRKNKKQKLPGDIHSMAEAKRRVDEIKKYGRILSLRPSIEHKSEKKYSRKRIKDLDNKRGLGYKESHQFSSNFSRSRFEKTRVSVCWIKTGGRLWN